MTFKDVAVGTDCGLACVVFLAAHCGWVLTSRASELNQAHRAAQPVRCHRCCSSGKSRCGGLSQPESEPLWWAGLLDIREALDTYS